MTRWPSTKTWSRVKKTSQPRDGLRLSRSPSVKVQAAATQGEEVPSGDLSAMPLLEVIDLLAQKRHTVAS